MRWLLLGSIWECLAIEISIKAERARVAACDHPPEMWIVTDYGSDCGACGRPMSRW